MESSALKVAHAEIMVIKKQITKQHNYTIEVSKAGLVAIFVSARCKSKKQINSNIDEDLRTEINGLSFREIPPEKNAQHFNIPPAFNGSELKGLKKTVVFLIVLDKGKHTISLIPRDTAFVEEIRIQELNGLPEVKLKIEEQAEEGNRRPWYTFTLIDLPLKTLSADVTVKWRTRDSDDVKLIVNNKIKTNILTIFHIYWLWSANIFKKLFKRERQTKTFKENLVKGIHYIELWADRMPTLHWVKMDLGKVPKYTLKGKIALYKDIILSETVNLRSRPKLDEKYIIGKLPNGTKLEILDSQVEDTWVEAKSFIWHKVKYQDKEGYVLSSFIEIEGQERKVIIQKIKEEAKKLGLDVDFVLALAGCESRYKPYACSASPDSIYQEEPYKGEQKAAKGIFQLTPPALLTLKQAKGKYHYTISDVFNIDENIKAGCLYLLWLIDMYYKGVDDEKRKLIVAWNQGQTFVPSDKLLDYKRIPEEDNRTEAQRTVKCVLKNLKRENWRSIILPIFLIVFSALLSIQIWSSAANKLGDKGQVAGESAVNHQKDQTIPTGLVSIDREKIISQEFAAFEALYYYDFDVDGQEEIIYVREYNKSPILDPHIQLRFRQNTIQEWQEVDEDIYGFFTDVSIWQPHGVLVIEAQHGKVIDYYLYQWRKDKGMVSVPVFADGERYKFLGSAGGTIFFDAPPFFPASIFVYYRDYPPGVCQASGTIYKLYGDYDGYKIIKVWDMEQTEDWCEHFRG